MRGPYYLEWGLGVYDGISENRKKMARVIPQAPLLGASSLGRTDMKVWAQVSRDRQTTPY